MQAEIEASAFRYQAEVEAGERVVVGVNAFTEQEEEHIELLQVDPEGERRQKERTARVRAERDATAAEAALAEIRRVAETDENLLPPMREALRVRAHRSGRSAASCATSGGRMTRRVLALAALLALAAPLVALAATRGGDATPSFTRDVAPIIQQKCAGCHQIGGIAPFPLETAAQARSKAPLIAAAVQARVMPPWPPGNRSPAYVGEGERKLTATERATILAWARAGGRVDGPARKPLPPKGVPVAPGESVLRMRMPAAYRPKAPKGATDDYRCFLLDPKLAADSAVTSARIEPGQPKVVHHVILFRVSKAQVAEARQLDAKSAGQGWTCFGGTGLSLGDSASGVQDALNNANWIAAWAPGFGGARVPGRHRSPAARGQPGRDAGALQPAERPRAGPLGRRAHGRSRAREAEAAADDAPPRPRGARLRERRARPALQPERGARRALPQVRAGGRVRPGRAAHPLPRHRDPARERRLHLRPADLAADDDPRRGRAHAPARSVDPARAQPRDAEGADPARHPALGLPLAERVHPGARGRGRRRATSSASRAATTCTSGCTAGTASRPRRATCSGARGRPTRCAWASSRSRAGRRRCASSSSRRCTRGRKTPISASSSRTSSGSSRARGHDFERAVVDRRRGGRRRHLGLAWDAFRAARRFRPDVVYAHFLVPAGLAAALASRAPLVVTAHGQDVENARSSRLVRRATRYVVGRAAAVIAVSEWLRGRLGDAVPEAIDKTKVVDCGVDLERFRPRDARAARSQLGLETAGTAFLCLGALSERKNVLRLARAFERRGEGTLTFVGDGPLRGRSRAAPGSGSSGGSGTTPSRRGSTRATSSASRASSSRSASRRWRAWRRRARSSRRGSADRRVRAAGGGSARRPAGRRRARRRPRRRRPLPRPNLAARAAAEAHDVKRQAERVEAILERAVRDRPA